IPSSKNYLNNPTKIPLSYGKWQRIYVKAKILWGVCINVSPRRPADRVRSVAGSLQLTSDNRKLDNLSEKFQFLSACFQELQHGVPNSQVHELCTVADVIAFYETPVDTTAPLDALRRTDLPENLHMQYEYLRFNPETDTKFNGKTAFPKSSTLVTGLKYRGKYEGHEAKRSWP
ncbi:39S ribosomal protein L50, mitochondrial, partial [Drosophila miranda]|uniref:39S ribosomal protein L50, mitochondrial n=1 Tax=Drosophila miranda TaxID=7229 RepID=UPI00143F8EC9